MTNLVAVDIGGTHARFTLARAADGQVALEPEAVLKTGDYPGLAQAWRAYAEQIGRPLPPRAGIAVAAPVSGDVIRLTNNHWTLDRAQLASELGLEALVVVNDFEAVAHGVPACEGSLRRVCGPDRPLPARGVVSVVGPGTGLGVAILHRLHGHDEVIATEGGHVGFAPLEEVGGRLHRALLAQHGRASQERVVSGPGLRHICAALGRADCPEDSVLWRGALTGDDPLTARALELFCLYLGAAAGDFALAHGADAVVIAGGVGLRLADRLAESHFAEGFVAKGRFEAHMKALPVKLLTHPQPGLLGAAAAFGAAQI